MPLATQPRCSRRCAAARAARVCALLAPVAGGADPARQAMQVQLLSPAISGDGKQVAIASLNPAGEAGASGSLALFDGAGVLRRRIALFAPARDAERARKSYAEAAKILEEGAFRRMGRVKRNSERTALRRAPSDPPPSFEGVFSQGDFGFTVRVADGKVRFEAMKGSRKLGTWSLKLGKEAPCSDVAGYSVSPTRAGFEAERRLVAFSVYAETKSGDVCFSHDYVVAMK
ncbi:MAG: hypothetical protein HY906_17345 [Deltaproteobacteria bacterium]|nr:hypothetical protein [Deltaproteobacteria bacterium]